VFGGSEGFSHDVQTFNKFIFDFLNFLNLIYLLVNIRSEVLSFGYPLGHFYCLNFEFFLVVYIQK
jgi:hypothetical protein